MRFRFWALVAATVVALGLSACTKQYSDGRNISSGDTVRPGGAPVGVGAQPGGPPVDSADAVSDPNAPKESNGGSGKEETRLSTRGSE